MWVTTEVEVWDKTAPESSTRVIKVLEQHTLSGYPEQVNALVLGEDCSSMASGSSNDAIWFWNRVEEKNKHFTWNFVGAWVGQARGASRSQRLWAGGQVR